MAKRKLQQTTQCKTCPFIKANDPYNIPRYNRNMHEALSNTIAEPSEINLKGNLHCMACHYSPDDNPYYCVGWLNHQLGVGNNIALRFQMMNYSNVGDIKVLGEQHEKFIDTLPEK